jgi:hypothetical protein
MSQGASSIYIGRAQLNQEILQILFYFGYKKHFIVLVMQKPSEKLIKEVDDFTIFC